MLKFKMNSNNSHIFHNEREVNKIKLVRNAIITGAGRNRGIGAEICRTLAHQGVNIYFTSHDDYDSKVGDFSFSDYEITLNECLSAGAKAFFQCIDLTEPNAVGKMFDDAEDKLGCIDILINCACFHVFDDIESITIDILNDCFNVNAKATLLMCKEFHSRNTSGNGSIILLSSTQELDALTQEISYAISKSSVPTIVSTLAPVMARKGIRINAVNPGATEIGDKRDRNIEVYRNENLFGRLGHPLDTANLIRFLVSDEGKWITGQTINSEGGLFRGVR